MGRKKVMTGVDNAKDIAQPVQVARRIFGIFWLIVGAIILFQLYEWNIIPHPSYDAEHFGIEQLRSPADADNDGTDDYTDIMESARAYIETDPEYVDKYYEGGYPPDGEGVCTDVIWKAFEGAGYDLKALVDADIAGNTDAYSEIDLPDPNIDFRRVKNLIVFFSRNAEVLTTDTGIISEWQPGDIVVYNNHIGVISDKRNRHGVAFLIHNAGQPVKEEDVLENKEIRYHFRWAKESSD